MKATQAMVYGSAGVSKNDSSRGILRKVAVAMFIACAFESSYANKFGIVDMQKVILNVSEGKAARAKLEEEIKKIDADLKKERDALNKMGKDIQGQAALLSEAARATKQQEFQEKFMELRNKEMKLQQEIKAKEQNATQDIAMKVAKMVEKMSQKQDFDAVFETSSAGLLYLKNPTNLTDEVIKTYEAENKVTEPAKKK